MIPGLRFGSLVVLELRRGAKNVHPTAVCQCDCGRTRQVRQSALRRRQIECCAKCVDRWATRLRSTAADRDLRDRESTYKCNARRKGVAWELGRQQFQALALAACRYCGVEPARGIDRLDNSSGYTIANAVPCCATCNYAKREMSADDFIAWVGRVFRHAFQ